MAEKKQTKTKVKKKKAAREKSFRKEKPKTQEKVTEEKSIPVTDVLKFVLMTEKAVQLIESQNKLVFIVDRRASKPKIMKAAEMTFNSKISDVTTSIDQDGRKKAFIKFAKEGEAGEIAIRLGII